MGGVLAVISTHHVAGGDEAFFEEVQACYERFDPSTPPGLRLPTEDQIPSGIEGVDRFGGFDPVAAKRTSWERTYTTQEYRDLLMTYSGHRALERGARRGLLDCIGTLIDGRFGGGITKRYLFELAMAARIDRAAD